MEHLNDHT